MKQKRTTLILTLILSSFTFLFTQPFIVTNTMDNGGVDPLPGQNTGTLRQAIVDANNNPGADVIQFSIAAAPPFFIFLQNPLPALTDGTGVLIDGFTQPGASPNTAPQGSPSNAMLQIVVSGNGFDGFTIHSSNNTIQGLIINNCNRAVHIDGSVAILTNLNKVLGCYIGTDQIGIMAQPNSTGVEISNGAGDFALGNLIGDGTAGGRNVISGNTNDGILIHGPGTDGNVVLANYIGTDANATASLSNGRSGVVIRDGAAFNRVGPTVGLTTTAERNVISGNGWFGVEIEGSATNSNEVVGSFIGTDASGMFAVPNGQTGVRLANHTKSNLVGSSMNAACGNVISGNGTASPGWDGVAILDTGTSYNVVEANYIGLNSSGLTAIGNANNGVSVFTGAHHNDIGKMHRNVISGNANDGVWIDGTSGTHDNWLANNYIGLNANGLAVIANGRHGILINGGAVNNKVGAASGSASYISGNTGDGIRISNVGTNNTTIQYCRIGVDINGLASGNGGNGIHVSNLASNVTIGGPNPFEQVSISYNTGHGIYIDNATNVLMIGPGIGSVTGQNVVSYNGANGLTVVNAGATGNTFSKNSIFGNTGLDIDLNNDGVTPNDAGDPDIGPNQLLNFPVIISATYIAPAPIYGGNLITGTVDVPNPTTSQVEIYSTGTAPHPSGYGGGDTYLATAVPDGAGNWSITINGGPGQPYASVGETITALTIDAAGNTSEFGQGAGIYLDVNMDPNALVQNEVSMAIVSPVPPIGPPKALLAAYNDDPYPGGAGIGVSNSLDAGTSWMPQQLPVPMDPFAAPGTPFVRVFDPSATADFYGNFHVIHIADDNNWTTGPASGLFVHTSPDMGMTWNPPVMIAANPAPVSNPDPAYRYHDRCQITADKSVTSPFAGNLYVTWIQDRGWNSPTPTSDIYFSSSPDGISWSPPVTINTVGNLANMPTIDVAHDGTIYICWVDYNVITGGMGTIYLSSSMDGGATWLAPEHTVLTYSLPPINVLDGTGSADALAKGAAVVGVAPNNAQQVYITYAALGQQGDDGDIFFIRSTAGGAAGSWSAPLRINDDPLPPAATPDQILPWMDIKPNGIIDIAWYDRRNDPNDVDWDVYLTTSTDGGITFFPNMLVNTMPASPTPNTPSGLWMGEYLGLVSDYNQVFIGFTSSFSDINGDVYFMKLANPVLPMDYGDAPDPLYPTFRMNDGARHHVLGQAAPWLGSVTDFPDIEPDGQPDPLAMGDDIILPDDENGVSLPAFSPGGKSTITFEVQNGMAFVDGWVDFNKNGTWGDIPSEYIFGGYFATGIHNVQVNTPGNLGIPLPYSSFARFRINSFFPLSPSGFAFDGEVEDYTVYIEPMSWVGGMDSLWNNPDNWNCRAVPDSTIDVVIPATAVQTPVIGGNAHCHNLLIEDGATLILQPGGTLTVHGNMVVGGGTSGTYIMYGGNTRVKGRTDTKPGAIVDIKAGSFDCKL